MKAIFVLVLVARLASAESSADIAARRNEDGKDLMAAKKLKEAGGKFRAAASLDPQPKYYFNLCLSLYGRSMFGAALEACKMATTLHPTPQLQTKIENYVKRITTDATSQHSSLEPVEATAAGSNDAGADLMFAGEYALAVTQFRNATALEPAARYGFNLCTALYQVGRFAQANTACRWALANKPTTELRAKAERTIKNIARDATAQHITLMTTPEPGSAADFAMAADQDGEALRDHDLDAARLKFREAVARDPQASYFYNLCAVDAALGKPDEAADACKAVLTHQPSAALEAKANAWLAAAR